MYKEIAASNTASFAGSGSAQPVRACETTSINGTPYDLITSRGIDIGFDTRVAAVRKEEGSLLIRACHCAY